MKLGIIQAQNPAIHSSYYFLGMTLIKNLQIVSNKKLSNAIIGNIEEIENDGTLDYVLYDWCYLNKEKKIPNAKAKIITFMGGDKIYWTVNQDFLNKSYLCFKSSCPKDLDILKNELKRKEPFNKKGNNLSNENIDKIKPLMYIAGISDFPFFQFTREIVISFIGSITSWNRIQAIKIAKEKFNNDFYGGFIKDTRGERAFDEDGIDIANIDVSSYLFKHGLNQQEFIHLIKRSIINLSPSGWGSSTHRWVEILCSGGFCLSCDLSHINYGIFSPKSEIHYISYKNDMSDLVDKIEYFKTNPEKAEEIGNSARKFMENTYLKPDIMAKEYIMKYL